MGISRVFGWENLTEIFLWGTILLIGIIGVVFLETLLLKLIFILVLIIVITTVYIIYENNEIYDKQRIFQEIMRNASIFEVDMMNGNEFEFYLKELYSSMGFHVQMTRGSSDFGADLILINEYKKIVVQAKRYSKNVGLRAVQEVVAAQMYYNATEAWVVTNSYFTQQAKELASSNSVTLIDRNQLIHKILLAKQQDRHIN